MDDRPKSRLAVVVSHPIQYYSAVFRALAAQPGLELRVFYLWDFGVRATLDPKFGKTFAWDTDLLSGYVSEMVSNVSPRPGAEHFGGFDNPEIGGRLAAWRPDAVLLFGYKWKTHLRVIAWARRHRVPLIFRGDSHLLGRRLPALHALALRLLFRQFAAFTVVGSANRAYVQALGARPDRTFFAPHAVDRDRFNPANAAARQAAAAQRTALGLDRARRVVLFSGKFVPAKQPLELARAFLGVRGAGDVLLLAGDGELRPALEALAREAPEGVLRMLPFANQGEMPARYLLGDVFALPSRGAYETWGLAVNEAMQMGLPCLVSDQVGCQRDLVTDGETGWVFAAEMAGDLERKLREALAADLEPLRAKVQARIAGYTHEKAAAGILQAVWMATKSHEKSQKN